MSVLKAHTVQSLVAGDRLELVVALLAMRIEIVVYDGVDELDVVGPLEVFRSAAGAGTELDVSLVSRTPVEWVSGAYGLRFRPDRVYGEPADVLVVPGGGWLSRAAVGAWAEVRRGEWLALLAQAATRTPVMAGVCTGTLLLAHAGVIGDRRVATHHGARQELEALGATIVTDRVVDEGSLVTCGGVTSGIDLALWLVARAFGLGVADQLADRLEYAWFRPNP